MYDEISKERKEKDRVKRRAYVRMVTNLGGSLNLELFCDKVTGMMRLLEHSRNRSQYILRLGSEDLLQLSNARSTRQIRRLWIP